MRRWLTALATGVLIAALPALAQAAFVWTLTVVPTTATQGQTTTFTFTATNHDVLGKIGCMQVDLPGSFAVISIGNPVASNGHNWDTFPAGGNNVIARSQDGGGRLDNGESVTFTVRATPTTAGVKSLNNHIHSSENCGGTAIFGAPLTITITPSGVPTPTPTPSSTPAATPVPTPVVTPRPTPRPTPKPTPKPTPTSGASVPPRSTPTPTPAPSSTPEASVSASAPAATPSPSPAASAGGDPQALHVAAFGSSDGGNGGGTDNLGTGLDVLAMLDGPFVWFVPGAAVGIPGLLVLLFVALQALGALAWIPAVRRLSGDDDRRGPRGTPPGRAAS